jgi:hypothetical protein
MPGDKKGSLLQDFSDSVALINEGSIRYNPTTKNLLFRDDSGEVIVIGSTLLASTANGEGASLIGVEDNASNYTGSDLESILAEIATLSGLRGETGTYTGNGAASQIISGLSFQPKIVRVYGGSSGTDVFFRNDTHTGSNSARIDIGGVISTAGITAIGATSFTVGSEANINTAGYTYEVWG